MRRTACLPPQIPSCYDATKDVLTRVLACNALVIQTDPKNSDYVVASGGRRKVETYDEAAAGVFDLSTDSERARLAEDPFYRLEHAGRDTAVMNEAKPRLTQLIELRDQQRADDYSTSQLLRKRHRSRKKQEQAAAAAQASSATPLIPLLPETGEDSRRAALVKFKIKKRVALKAGSIFGVRSAAEQKKLDALSKIRTRGVDTSLFTGAARAAKLPGLRSSAVRPKPAAKFAHINIRPKD